MLFLDGIAGHRLHHILCWLLVTHLAQDAFGKRNLAVRARTDAEIVAERPVVEVMCAARSGLRT